MRRLCLCLLLLLACADLAAREVRLSSADSGSAPDTASAAPAPKAEPRRTTAPRDAAPHEARVRPSVHSDVGSGPRMRWHSFLPGMFR